MSDNSSMSVDAIAAAIRAGERLTPETARTMYLDAPTPLLGRLADDVRRAKHPGGVVTYIIDRNVNYTNVCVARCKFCAFYRPVGSAEGYTLGFDEIYGKIEETIRLGGGQLLLQGGHNPDVPLAWYEDLFRGVKQRYPDFRLHALSPPEVIHISRLAQLPVPRRHRPADRGRSRQHSRRRRRDPGGSRAQDSELLQQGDRRRVARRHARRPCAPACARPPR